MIPGVHNELNSEDTAFLSALVNRETGVVLGQDKTYLIQARLAILARSMGYRTPAELTQALRNGLDPAIKEQVVDALLTKETSFFRHPESYETLVQKALAELASRPERSYRPVRIWSAACSTGQEPFSIAMSILEAPGLISRMGAPEIFATDISRIALKQAEEGRYNQSEISRGLPTLYTLRYFRQDGHHYVLSADVREMVRFRQLDLLKQVYLPRSFDIIFCRNVGIYFSEEDKKLLYERLAGSLSPMGYLFLGASESATRYDVPLAREQWNNTTFYRPKETT